MGLYQRNAYNLVPVLNGTELLGIDTGDGTPNASCTTAAIAALANFGAISPFGVAANGRKLSDITTTANSTTITSASYKFQFSDIGKLITIAGAGTSSAVLNTTIAFVNFVGGAILTTAPRTSISGTGVATFGTDDTAAWQALVNTLSSSIAGGGTIIMPIGISIVSSITWASNVSLFGWGAGKSILKHIMTTDATVGMIYLNSTPGYAVDMQFSDFEMDMEAATATGGYQVLASCIRIAQAERTTVTRCHLHGSPATTAAFDYGIEIKFTQNIVANYGRLATASSQGGAGYGSGISSGTVQSHIVTDNMFIGDSAYIGVARGTYGVFFEEETSASTIDANAITNNNIFIGTATKAAIGDCGLRHFECVGNRITSQTNNTGAGIAIQGGTTGFDAGDQGLIANNVITAITGSGIQIDYTAGIPSGQVCGYAIIGNRIRAATGHGIKVTANASAALTTLIAKENFIEGCTFTGMIFLGAGGFADLTLGGNTIINNGSGGSGITAVGIAFEAAVARLTMMDDDIYDNGTGTQKYAIGVNTGIAITGAWIVGNNLANNASGAISLIGGATIAGVIKDNNGYNPVGASALSPGGSPWTFTAGNSPGTLYLSASTSITALTQNGTSILPAATGAAVPLAVPFNANDAIIVTYTGALSAQQMVN